MQGQQEAREREPLFFSCESHRRRSDASTLSIVVAIYNTTAAMSTIRSRWRQWLPFCAVPLDAIRRAESCPNVFLEGPARIRFHADTYTVPSLACSDLVAL